MPTPKVWEDFKTPSSDQVERKFREKSRKVGDGLRESGKVMILDGKEWVETAAEEISEAANGRVTFRTREGRLVSFKKSKKIDLKAYEFESVVLLRK